MSAKFFLVIGSISGFLSVVIGAFAAHALKNRLSPEMFQIFEVGARYQMYHTFALIVVGLALTRFTHPVVSLSGWFFLAGMIIFSGSLYALSLSEVRVWGAVTPIGGLLLLAGWVILTLGVIKS